MLFGGSDSTGKSGGAMCRSRLAIATESAPPTAIVALSLRNDDLSRVKVPMLPAPVDNLGNLKVVMYLSGSSRVTIAKGGVNVRGNFF